MKKAIRLFWGLLYIAWPLWGADHTGPVLTNTDFLMDIITKEMGKQAGSPEAAALAALKGKDLYLHAGQSSPGDWLFEYAAIEVFNKMNVRVIKAVNRPVPPNPAPAVPRDTAASASLDTGTEGTAAVHPMPDSAGQVVLADAFGAAGNGCRLDYRLVECKVVYDQIWRESLIGKKNIRRSGTVTALVQLVDLPSGTVLWQKKIAAQSTDLVPYARKAFIENSEYNFVKLNDNRPYWKDFLEITLAGGSVGYVLYLFFSKSFN